MPQVEVRTMPADWQRVGREQQESRGHRVYAHRDFDTVAWWFMAIRRGDGINPCKQLGTFDTAAEARSVCEADAYMFHVPTYTPELMDKLRTDVLTASQFVQQKIDWEDEKAQRRYDRKAIKKLEKRERAAGRIK